MSTATARAYRSNFTGRIAPARSRKIHEIKLFCGRRSTHIRDLYYRGAGDDADFQHGSRSDFPGEKCGQNSHCT